MSEHPRRPKARKPTLRAVGLGALGLSLASLAVLMADALRQGRLPSAEERIPTALYSRPIPWGRSLRPAPSVPVGTVDGSMMEQRQPVTLDELPPDLIDAVLAIEDQRFFHHRGLELRRIGAAFIANLKAGAITQGGSTLSQQLAKNLFLSPGRSLIRKIREAAIATVLEARYDKRALLQAYLNEIYLGQGSAGPIHGVGAAARYYFGKDASELSLAESALLAGMIKAPNRYAPDRNPELARQRRDLVLHEMVEQERVLPEDAEAARRTPLPTRVHSPPRPEVRWFRDYAVRFLPRGLPRRGTAVHTTLDAGLQEIAERAIRVALNRLRLNGVQTALVAIDPRSGEVLAMVGGRSYDQSQFNRATTALRQPGSAFKPIVAIAALEPGPAGFPAYTLASLLEDAPLFVPTSSGPWRPSNYDRQFRGYVTLRTALEQSLNVPFARLGLSLGPSRIAETAERLGITSPLRPVPSLALGSSEVTLLELTRAYGVLAAGGNLAATQLFFRPAPYGMPTTSYEPEVRSAVEAPVAYLVTSTLEGVVLRGTGRALQGRRFGPIAGKTGTSSEWRDAWFIAYTPSLVVGAWLGYDDGQSLRLTGSMGALPIVREFLTEAAPRIPPEEFVPPSGIAEAHAQVGLEWPWECGRRELFLVGTEPLPRPCIRLELPGF